MKILMIGDSVYPDTMGGSHRHIHDISRALSERGNDIVVYSPKPKPESKGEEMIDGFKVMRYNRGGNKAKSLIDFIFGPYRIFKKELKNGYRPDVIHGHWPLTVFLIFLYVRLRHLPIKLVYTFHGPAYEEYKIELKQNVIVKNVFLQIVKMLEQTVLNLSDSISTASEYMKKKAIALYGNERKIVVNYHFVDIYKFRIDERKDFKGLFLKDHKYVISIRRIKKRMGLQLLINSFVDVLRQVPNCELLIGGKGNYEGELKNLAKSLHIQDHVHFLGFLPDDDLKYYYSKSDVCVVPSQDLEGFGLTTAEALACGTPVVATNRCANPELLKGITPELLAEYNADDMSKKIILALNKNYDSQKLRSYIMENFNIDKMLDGYLKLYNSK